MDLNRSQGSQHLRAHERYREAMVDLVRRTRSKLQSAREQAAQTSQEQAATRRAQTSDNLEVDSRRAAERERKDRIDISEDLHERLQAARLDEADEGYRPKVERLKHAYRAGQLNTPERFERAAENLLRNADAPERRREHVVDRLHEAHQDQRAHQARRSSGDVTDPANTEG